MIWHFVAVLVALIPALITLPTVQALVPQLIDITPTFGIKFRHQRRCQGKELHLRSEGRGTAFLDFDNDGWMSCWCRARLWNDANREAVHARCFTATDETERLKMWSGKTPGFRNVSTDQHYLIDEQEGLRKEDFAGMRREKDSASSRVRRSFRRTGPR